MSNGNNPYAPDAFNSRQPQSGPQAPDPFGDNAPRISKMAITSLVLALICCIPPLPSIAVAFGAGALIRIRGANGRLTGTVLAIFGVILGLIFSAIQIAIIVGVVSFAQRTRTFVSEPAAELVASIASGDPTVVRAMIAPSQGVTDEQIRNWFALLKTEVGEFKREAAPTSVNDALAMSGRIRDASLVALGTSELGFFPVCVPTEFEFNSATAFLCLYFPEEADVERMRLWPSDPRGRVRDIALVTPDGRVIRLIRPSWGLSGQSPEHSPALPVPAPTP